MIGKVFKTLGAFLTIAPAIATAAVWIWAIFLQTNPDAAAAVFTVTLFSVCIFVVGLVLLGVGYIASL
jgi:hypothetical protein